MRPSSAFKCAELAKTAVDERSEEKRDGMQQIWQIGTGGRSYYFCDARYSP